MSQTQIKIKSKRFVQISSPNPFGWKEAAFTIELENGSRVMVIAVDPDSVDHPELQNIIRARLICSATQECPICGAVAQTPNREQRRRIKRRGGLDAEMTMPHQIVEHEDECPVMDENLRDRIAAIYGIGKQ